MQNLIIHIIISNTIIIDSLRNSRYCFTYWFYLEVNNIEAKADKPKNSCVFETNPDCFAPSYKSS